MTALAATAPGKLVLLGEYAVLEGAPALVLAVDRRVRVHLSPIAGDAWEIVAPTLQLQGRLQPRDGAVHWIGDAADELAWVANAFAQVPQAVRAPACRIELDSTPFYFKHAGTSAKLGLGSSAALTVALLGALHAYARLAPPTLAEAMAAHRTIQGGHGSGIDIAAAFTGGLSRFQLHAATAQIDPATLPAGLHWCCVYAGRPTSTRVMLATVAAWRARAPVAFGRRIHELATISSRGINAAAANDAAAFLSCLNDYAHALARFGEAAGADIASLEQRALGALAANCGCVYKSCGAGGGDVGITLAVEDTRLREFATRAARAGFPVIDLHADPQGLVVASTA